MFPHRPFYFVSFKDDDVYLQHSITSHVKILTHPEKVKIVKVSHSQDELICAVESGDIYCWNFKTGEYHCVRNFIGDLHTILPLRSGYVVCVSYNSIVILNPERHIVRRHVTHAQNIVELDHERIVLWKNRELIIWNFMTNHVTTLVLPNCIENVIVLNNGKLLCLRQPGYLTNITIVNPNDLTRTHHHLPPDISGMFKRCDGKIVFRTHKQCVWDPETMTVVEHSNKLINVELKTYRKIDVVRKYEVVYDAITGFTRKKLSKLVITPWTWTIWHSHEYSVTQWHTSCFELDNGWVLNYCGRNVNLFDFRNGTCQSFYLHGKFTGALHTLESDTNEKKRLCSFLLWLIKDVQKIVVDYVW